jgi:hypothetical protein
MSCYFWCQYFKLTLNVNKNHYLVFTCENVLKKIIKKNKYMSFNVVRLSLLQVMMVSGLFLFGKQALPFFLVQYVVYHIHHIVSTVGHHYCPIAC